jgi:hypothetical protein
MLPLHARRLLNLYACYIIIEPGGQPAGEKKANEKT